MQGVLTSGIYPLQEENQAPRLGYCDMSINGYLDADLETSIGYLEAFPNPGRIIFSAYKQEGDTFSGDVTYTGLVENVGGGMDTATGIFTTPQDGLYMFSFSGVTHRREDYIVRLRIYKNGGEEFDIYTSQNKEYDVFESTISHTWLSDLKVGDKIQLKLEQGYMFSDDDVRISFNGYLVK